MGRDEKGVSSDAKQTPRRRYPPLYERLIPIALVALAGLILVILGIVAAVLLGLFPGA